MTAILTGCGDVSNPVIRDIQLAEASTHTEQAAVANDPIRLHLSVKKAQMIQLRAWAVGYLVGVEVSVANAAGDAIYTQISAGTDIRIDGLRLDEPGEYVATVRWLVGSGVASYKYTVLSGGPSPLNTSLISDLAVSRLGHQVTVLTDGRVLVTGGHADGDGTTPAKITATASAEVIDPESGESTPVEDMAQPRAYHSAVLITTGADEFRDKVLIAGGLGPKSEALVSTELFDPSTNTFEPGPFLLQPRAFMETLVPQGSGSFLDGKIVLGGGERTRSGPQHDRLDELYSEIDENPTKMMYFDPEVGEVKDLKDLEIGRLHATMTLLPDGRILVIGGGVDTIPSAPGCDEEDPGCICSNQVPLCTRFECTGTEDGDCTYTNYTRKDVGTRSVEVYDTTGVTQWTTFEEPGWLTRGRVGHSAAVVSGGFVVVAGGATAERRSFHASEFGLPESPATLDSVELFDPNTNTFEVLPPVNIPREQAATVTLATGDVLLLGGYKSVPGGMAPVSLIERYDATTRRFTAIDNLRVARGLPGVAHMSNDTLLVIGGDGASGPVDDIERVAPVGAD